MYLYMSGGVRNMVRVLSLILERQVLLLSAGRRLQPLEKVIRRLRNFILVNLVNLIIYIRRKISVI